VVQGQVETRFRLASGQVQSIADCILCQLQGDSGWEQNFGRSCHCELTVKTLGEDAAYLRDLEAWRPAATVGALANGYVAKC